MFCAQVFSVGKVADTSSAGAEDCEALDFKLSKVSSPEDSSAICPSLTVRMASVQYVHCPQFLQCLQRCAAHFRQRLSHLLRLAAKEVALGLAVGRSVSLAENIELLSTSFIQPALDETDGYMETSVTSPAGALKLKVEIASPIIAIPQAANSGKVLVANLGQIEVHNTFEEVFLPSLDIVEGHEEQRQPTAQSVERKHITVKDMHLAALQLDVDLMQNPPISLAQPAYFVTSHNPCGHVFSILDDTAIAATIDSPQCPEVDEQPVPALFAVVKVVGPLNVVLSKNVFRQITSTLESLTTGGDGPNGDKDDPNRTDNDLPRQENVRSDDTIRAREHSQRAGLIFGSPRLASSMGSTGSGSIDSGESMSECWKGPMFHGTFHIPTLQLELHTELHCGEEGLVRISLHDCRMQASRAEQFLTRVAISLRSLLIIDLLQPVDSKHRFLMSSATFRSTGGAPANSPHGLRGGLPGNVVQRSSLISSSLPLQVFSSLSSAAGRAAGSASFSQASASDWMDRDSPDDVADVLLEGCNSSSTSEINGDETLVQVKVVLVDKQSPTFYSQYKGVSCQNAD